MQVAPMLKPVIVNDAGLPSLAGADAGDGVPLEQLTLIVTLGPPSGE